jgi:uncharacterized protein YqgC (DUF456 family)
MEWLYYILLLALLLVGVFLNLLTLPGLWLMLFSALVYGWITHWHYIGLWTLVTLTAIAAISELLENLAGGIGAKKLGGSPRAARGALIGGILGGLLLSIPVPLIGTIIGVCVGVFAGALIAEYSVHGNTGQSVAVGLGATGGRLAGILLKIGLSLVMLIVTLVAAWPHHKTPSSTIPATSPSTVRSR